MDSIKLFLCRQLKPIIWIGLVIFSANFTDGAKRDSIAAEPSFVEPEEGSEIFSATIHDEATASSLKKVSFFGQPSIPKVLKEDDDSVNTLELGKMKELIIVKKTYTSQRHPDREFCLARAVMASGAAVENLLIPKNLVVCGIDKKTGIKRAWLINKIDNIVVDGSTTGNEPAVAVEEAVKKFTATAETP